MLDRFRDYSGGIYQDPRVNVHVDDGRSFVRRSPTRYDVIQASLVDTWAATAAGAYTLTENSLYTAEAFGEYLDHLSDRGILTITRWVFDGLRLVSLAQAACAERGLDASKHLAIVRFDRVATFLLKKTPFTEDEVLKLRQLAHDLGFTVLYAPGIESDPIAAEPAEMVRTGTSAADYRRLILAPDRERFLAEYPLDIRPTTDDRPFFFHTTRLANQFEVAFGRTMLFGNGLSALLTLFGISAALVLLFIVGPLLVGANRPGAGWPVWLAYFGALGAGFMLLEVALLQQFVLLLGHPVYSLTVTLFSLLLGTGVGSLISRRIADARVKAVTSRAIGGIVLVSLAAPLVVPWLIDVAIPWPLAARIALAVAILLPLGVLLGIALPGGCGCWPRRRPDIVPWGWGHERRILGRRSDAGGVHRDELGIFRGAGHRGVRLRDGGGHASGLVERTIGTTSRCLASRPAWTSRDCARSRHTEALRYRGLSSIADCTCKHNQSKASGPQCLGVSSSPRSHVKSATLREVSSEP